MKKSWTVFKRGDLLLFLSVIAVALILILITHIPSPDGRTAIVKSAGKTLGEYPLSENAEIPLPSEEGGYNILVIEDGHAYIRDASCPDKLCMHQGRISELGDTLICLPNRLSVIISD